MLESKAFPSDHVSVESDTVSTVYINSNPPHGPLVI